MIRLAICCLFVVRVSCVDVQQQHSPQFNPPYSPYSPYNRPSNYDDRSRPNDRYSPQQNFGNQGQPSFGQPQQPGRHNLGNDPRLGNMPKTPLDRLRYAHSDSRCMEDILTFNPEEIITVATKYGKVTGRYSYLCDMPGVAERDRPVVTTQFDSHHHGYRPRARVRGNVTLFWESLTPSHRLVKMDSDLRFGVFHFHLRSTSYRCYLFIFCIVPYLTICLA